MRKVLFITGTDTGVGKTFVAERLLAMFARQGLDVIGMKPVETGFTPDGAAESDTGRLLRASNLNVTMEDVCLYRLAWPASPLAAAQREGVTIDVEAIHEAVERYGRYPLEASQQWAVNRKQQADEKGQID